MLKIKVTGSYLKDKNSRDYEITLFMPEVADKDVQVNVMRRAVPMELRRQGISMDYLRSCYIESIEQVDKSEDAEENKLIKDCGSYIGKNIKDMSHEECQNTAIAYCLLDVPLYRDSELRDVRQKLYFSYATNVVGQKLNPDFNYTEAPALKVDGKATRKKTQAKQSNSDVLDALENAGL